MLKLKQAIAVEGKYDLNALSQVVDAPIFTTDGFGVMKNRALVQFLRRVARERGLVILTDPDGAGFVIRNYLSGVLPREGVYHAYVPDVAGKERRKTAPGREGKLGVEGMPPAVLEQALLRAGVPLESGGDEPREQLTKADLARCGLAGSPDAEAHRAALKRALQLPEHMSANALLRALNILFDRTTFMEKYGHD